MLAAVSAAAQVGRSASADEEPFLVQNIPSVFGASKYEQRVSEAPASVTLITSEEIKKYGYRTVADILRSVRSFYVIYDRNYSFVGTRGFGRLGGYNNRLLFLIDGLRYNDNIFDGALIGTDFVLDVDLIDRIEIIRGPASSLYGTSAFFGVVNIITKRGRDYRGTELAGAGATRRTGDARATYGDRLENNDELLLSASVYASGGNRNLYYPEFDAPATNNGVAHDVDGDKSRSFYTKYSTRRFDLQAAAATREKDIPTGSYGAIFNDPRNRTIDENMFLDLRYEHDLDAARSVSGRLHFNRYDYDGNYAYAGQPINRDIAHGEWWGGEAKLTQKLWERHRLIVGAEYQDNIRQDQYNADSVVPGRQAQLAGLGRLCAG
jgi:iron complex outermembrane receptor protein